MSGASSNAAGWFTQLEPASGLGLAAAPDEVRLNEIVERWQGDSTAVTRGRPVLIGYPHDEGVRRNGGRGGAALAPREIRRWLYRLTAWDPQHGIDLTLRAPLDAGDIRQADSMEQIQKSLGEVVGEVLRRNAVPVVLGGGHETAYGHYLGYVAAQQPVTIINLDAHLDVRPLLEGKGHSGSPFRQALEHPAQPLPGNRYICLGAQPQASFQKHVEYARQRGCIVRWRDEVAPALSEHFAGELDRTADGARQDLCIHRCGRRLGGGCPRRERAQPGRDLGRGDCALRGWRDSAPRCRAWTWSKSTRSSIATTRAALGRSGYLAFPRRPRVPAPRALAPPVGGTRDVRTSAPLRFRPLFIRTWCPCRAKRTPFDSFLILCGMQRSGKRNAGQRRLSIKARILRLLRFSVCRPVQSDHFWYRKCSLSGGTVRRDEASGLQVYNATVDCSVVSLRRAGAMLVLSRKLGEKIQISENITITVLEIDRGKIRLGIDAPRSVTVLRQELANQSLSRQSQQDPMLVGK